MVCLQLMITRNYNDPVVHRSRSSPTVACMILTRVSKARCINPYTNGLTFRLSVNIVLHLELRLPYNCQCGFLRRFGALSANKVLHVIELRLKSSLFSE
ncbi:hypothetical protein AOQ84DRAFT_2250 [Glonium stellatum]|uniref:Uncharacterized protein n=1 Tax=Glonium stellatum TaxID=574774 RepID=A0A8E2JLI0_9PEZI|nr:hypothetical protein AOQ84DRAFT_2250 [Glonium stellatum]